MTPQKALPTHTILDGKVHVFMRHGSPFWWVGFHFKGKYIRSSTKQKLLDGAKAVAQQWYFQKQTEIASGNISSPKHAFGKLADEALANYKKIFVDRGQRSQKTYDGIESIMKSRVKDYFSKMPVQQIDNSCQSFYGAVAPFRRILERRGITEPSKCDENLFLIHHRVMFNEILKKKNLKVTKSKPPLKRDFVSLRSTYICFRLLNGVPIYEIANNCRTSVAVIQEHYAKPLGGVLMKNINRTNIEGWDY
jgi:hypothetical protein